MSGWTGSSSGAEASHVSRVKRDRKTSACLLRFNIKAAGAEAQVVAHIISIIHTTTRFGPSGRENGRALPGSWVEPRHDR